MAVNFGLILLLVSWTTVSSESTQYTTQQQECQFNYECRVEPDDPHICFMSRCVEGNKKYGDVCQFDIQCNFNVSLCIHGMCDCKEGHVWFGGECVVENGYGYPCQTKNDCTNDKLECRVNGASNEKTCSCQPDLFYDDSTKDCLQQKSFGEECLVPKQCIGSRVSCRDGRCSCESGTIPVGKDCLSPKKHSERCSQSIECDYNEHLSCRNGMCQCMTRFEFLDGHCERLGCLFDSDCKADQYCDLKGRCKELPNDSTTDSKTDQPDKKYIIQEIRSLIIKRCLGVVAVILCVCVLMVCLLKNIKILKREKRQSDKLRNV